MKGAAFQKNVRTMRTKEKHMKKTKWLAACMVACALALVIGCRSGDDDEPDLPGVVEKNGWLMEGNTVRQYRGSEEKVTTPAGATIIGKHAFEGTGVKEVTIGEGVTVIEDSAFSGCKSLASVTIPASVVLIGDSAFSGCAKLTSVKIGGSVESIGSSAFYQCTSLASVEIPGSVKSIGERAFWGCRSLASVTIGEGVESIGELAFESCDSLESVEIPASVKSIGDYAFSSVKEVNYGGTAEQWEKIDIGSRPFPYNAKITDKDGKEISRS